MFPKKLFLFVFLGFFVSFGGMGWAADPVEIPMTVAATGKILIDVEVNGRPVTCIVDTGSPYFLLIDQVLVDQMHLAKTPVQARLRFFAEDQGGETYKVTLERVKIGPFRYENVRGLTIDDIRRATGTGYQDLPNFWAQGIVGIGFLQRFRVVIDYVHNRLILYPPDDATTFSDPPFAGFFIPVAGVSGPGPAVPFLIDTGSTFSVASEESMAPLGLSYISVSNGDSLFRGIAKADVLKVGSASFQGVTFEVADHFAQYAGGDSFRGIIGYDYLKSLVLDLNFPVRTVDLEKP